jgi:hypothetical protein
MKKVLESANISFNHENCNLTLNTKAIGSLEKTITIEVNSPIYNYFISIFTEDEIKEKALNLMRTANNLKAIKLIKDYYNIDLRKAKAIYDKLK